MGMVELRGGKRGINTCSKLREATAAMVRGVDNRVSYRQTTVQVEERVSKARDWSYRVKDQVL